MNNYFSIALVSSISLALCPYIGLATEVPYHTHSDKPTLLDGVRSSESIVIAEYQGFRKRRKGYFSYYCPPAAKYKLTSCVSGKLLPAKFCVRFEFHDKTNKIKPKNWEFKPSIMPKARSKWIILIKQTIPIEGQFETYHGSFGRIPYSEENLQKVLLCRGKNELKHEETDFETSSKARQNGSNTVNQFFVLERQYLRDNNLDELENLYETVGRTKYRKNQEEIDTKIAKLLYRQGRYKEAKAVMYKHFKKIKNDAIKFEKRKKEGRYPKVRCGNPAIRLAGRVKFIEDLEKKFPWLYPWQAKRILKERDLKFGRASTSQKN